VVSDVTSTTATVGIGECEECPDCIKLIGDLEEADAIIVRFLQITRDDRPGSFDWECLRSDARQYARKRHCFGDWR
jgi:hypothetical protein